MTNVDFISKIKEKILLGRGLEWVLITICLQEANNLPESILLKSQNKAMLMQNMKSLMNLGLDMRYI